MLLIIPIIIHLSCVLLNAGRPFPPAVLYCTVLYCTVLIEPSLWFPLRGPQVGRLVVPAGGRAPHRGRVGGGGLGLPAVPGLGAAGAAAAGARLPAEPDGAAGKAQGPGDAEPQDVAHRRAAGTAYRPNE